MPDGVEHPLRLAAPWYVHPASNPPAWERMLGGSDLAFAVVNASNGPAPGDKYYQEVLAGGSQTPLVGYVDTAYGARPAELILAEVHSWLETAPVSGIMFDCVPTVIRQDSWHLGLIDQARDLGAGTVVVNPGVPPDPALVQRADVTCVAEFDWATFQKWNPPEALRDMPAHRLWMLAHGVPAAEQPEAEQLLASFGAGLGWVTEGVLPDPWSTLPERW